MEVARLVNEWQINLTSVILERCCLAASYTSPQFADCVGRKEVVCPSCNKSKDANSYVSGQTTECSRCHGRGLLAHQDGSDTKYSNSTINYSYCTYDDISPSLTVGSFPKPSICFDM